MTAKAVTVAVERTIASSTSPGTALTEAHGDDAAVDLFDTVTAAAAESVADATAELVKTIGDAVMLAAPSPGIGLDAARRVFEACYANDAFLEPRDAWRQRYSGLGKSNRQPASHADRWLPCAGIPPRSLSVRAACIRFHVMNVVLRLVKSLSGPPDPGSR
jgi:hypothetical protein